MDSTNSSVHSSPNCCPLTCSLPAHPVVMCCNLPTRGATIALRNCLPVSRSLDERWPAQMWFTVSVTCLAGRHRVKGPAYPPRDLISVIRTAWTKEVSPNWTVERKKVLRLAPGRQFQYATVRSVSSCPRGQVAKWPIRQLAKCPCIRVAMWPSGHVSMWQCVQCFSTLKCPSGQHLKGLIAFRSSLCTILRRGIAPRIPNWTLLVVRGQLHTPAAFNCSITCFQCCPCHFREKYACLCVRLLPLLGNGSLRKQDLAKIKYLLDGPSPTVHVMLKESQCVYMSTFIARQRLVNWLTVSHKVTLTW
jgi:hypothetical protein